MTLDPRPIGWFAVARSGEVRRGRAVDGVLAAAPYRLGRRTDGRLWFTGGIGAVAEQNGFVFGWHHPGGAAPAWRVPALDETGWRPLRHTLLRARTQPQEVFENSIDVGHFPVIHGYRDIAVLAPMRLDGHEMRVAYRIARHGMVASFDVHLHGIGCAHNHIEVPAVGLRARMFALATPTEPGRVDIRLGVSVARSGSLRFILPLVHAGVAHSIVNDFRQDLAVWEHKRYVRPPMLVKGDGPIESFRRWSRQFSVAS
jgi:phenylpropionate dioxygenase-like ring-hydroxylating dioxygenase large terminal subunit